MSIRISAVICTYNRANYLRKAVRSLVEQKLSRDYYEILVVDNRSADNTREVVLREFSDVQNLHYLYEPVIGLSQARNTGWDNAKGEYVAYLDDDAIASSEWLKKILDIFETVRPKPGCVGGKIEPIWEAPRPPWLSKRMVLYLAILDWSKVPTMLNDKQWLAGANIAFPTHLLKALGGFSKTLGRRGHKLLSMEEIFLRRQLERKGYSCFYHPEILVWHHIPAQRLTKRWFLRRFYWSGVSNALMQIYQESPSTLKRLWMGIVASRRIFIPTRQLANLLMPTEEASRFALKCNFLARIGYVLGLLGIAR